MSASVPVTRPSSHWRMTEEDIEYALEQCRNGGQPSAHDNSLGLTSTSRRRLKKERTRRTPLEFTGDGHGIGTDLGAVYTVTILDAADATLIGRQLEWS
jgi:hypothetical protein